MECDALLLVFVNEKNHKFCFICEIVGEEAFSTGPSKSQYFQFKSF